MRRIKLLSRGFVAAALLMWGLFCYLTNHYDSTLPTVADRESGRIYSLNSHGHIVYLTVSEEFRMFFLVSAAVLCFLAGFLIDIRLRRLPVTPGPK